MNLLKRLKTGSLFLLSLFTFVTSVTLAQNNPDAVSFRKMAKEKSAKLHAEYPKVADVEFTSCKTVAERHEKVDKIWHDLWHNFTEYYHEKDLIFKSKRRLYVHLHFSETGHLDYFGYHFRHKENEKTKKFVALFKEFVENYKFDLAEGVKFSQCGQIHLKPRKGIKEGM